MPSALVAQWVTEDIKMKTRWQTVIEWRGSFLAPNWPKLMQINGFGAVSSLDKKRGSGELRISFAGDKDIRRSQLEDFFSSAVLPAIRDLQAKKILLPQEPTTTFFFDSISVVVYFISPNSTSFNEFVLKTAHDLLYKWGVRDFSNFSEILYQHLQMIKRDGHWATEQDEIRRLALEYANLHQLNTFKNW